MAFVTGYGAHVKGYNHCSYGICLVGGAKEENWKEEGMFTGSEMNACTLRCERLMFKKLGQLCLAHLAKYKTTFEDDI